MRSVARFQFGAKTRLRLYRKIISFLKQGLPLFDVLRRLEELYSKKSGDPRAIAIREWLTIMRNGGSFSQAIAAWVPVTEVMLVDGGERGGRLQESLGYAIKVSESMIAMRKAIVSSISYQLLLLSILIAMIMMFSLKIVPQLADILDPAKWPGAAASLYALSEFVKAYWYVVLGGIVALGFVIARSLPRWYGPLRQKFDAIPPWSIYRTVQSATFLVAVSALMKTGVPLMDAIQKLRELANPYMYGHLSKIIVNLTNGISNGRSMNVGFLMEDTANDIEIYGDLADFQTAMEQIGSEVIEDSVEAITVKSRSMGTAILIGIAVFVGWVYYAFFTLTSSISKNSN